MGKLHQTIRQLVRNEHYVIGQHAAERLEERGIMDWQVVAGLEDEQLLAERPADLPNPAIEVCELLPDGTEFKAVWSHLRVSNVANLSQCISLMGTDMEIEGQRVSRTRIVRTDEYVVAVDVEAVIPPDDPSEPCYEAETVQFLKEVAERAEAGDAAWLLRHGRVYQRMQPESVSA